ncbi:ppGpp synthetase/RelA/SpoT-type nucleotidyltransferase [Nocardia transvalensis]|uniref:PpGpp synthetase/RelA/SpoT-type nucleotidyltransferase n=1 Tax=Nocardia transvalensis TaxID=37333 RepID=A0A7W9PCM7_9NOCA|nr:hypothetical protein [Nocardia transvalensis]MBB5913595.1 ppGpp synthetase/RelA/SpoT-type nucleotidyltransferase [Nocardia transvalensis]
MPGGSAVDRWRSEYDSREPTYTKLKEEVEHEIRHSLKAITTHDIKVRVKTRASFLEKIERKRYEHPFEQMPDIVGARIVCLFLDDLKVVDDSLERCFDVIHKEDKTGAAPPDTFSYRSVHYECTIKETNSGTRYDTIKGLTFEVQARTILQDAWAVVEHTLAYKGGSSIPNELKRDFSALVGLFHVADKMFQQLRYSIERSELDAEHAVLYTKEMSNQSSTAVDEINRGTVKALLQQLYPDRGVTRDIAYSTFVEELTAAGFCSIAELRKVLERDSELIRSMEIKELREGPYGDDDGNMHARFADVGFARQILEQVSPAFQDYRREQRRTNKV